MQFQQSGSLTNLVATAMLRMLFDILLMLAKNMGTYVLVHKERLPFRIITFTSSILASTILYKIQIQLQQK